MQIIALRRRRCDADTRRAYFNRKLPPFFRGAQIFRQNAAIFFALWNVAFLSLLLDAHKDNWRYVRHKRSKENENVTSTGEN